MMEDYIKPRFRSQAHLPRDFWPAEDQIAFDAAFASGSILDDDYPPGAHLAPATRRQVEATHGRFLGFLQRCEPAALKLPVTKRLTPERVRGFATDLEVGPRGSLRKTTIASYLDSLAYGACLLAPEKEWSWLKRIARCIHAAAVPMDRHDRLVDPARALLLGLTRMEEAQAAPPAPHLLNELRFRDGLILALLSLWPLRRRSLAALTVSRHVDRHGHNADDPVWLLVYEKDTKSGRSARFPVPAELRPSLHHYLEVIRPRLLRHHTHDALWVSQRGTPLTGDAIYQAIRALTAEALNVPMGLHDFRRSAATHLAMSAPDKIGLAPAILQHKNPVVTEQHYNLAQSSAASKRHTAVIQKVFRNASRFVETEVKETI